MSEKFDVIGINEALVNYYYNYSNEQISEIKTNFNLACKKINKKNEYLKNSKLLRLGLLKLEQLDII